ncbi:putative at hook domain-containing protein [Golovinomyces cichoracearum]|uniref:Putative at hook domain-containing protein n=1 Tax=Golovinomyces cichoracearum TaxID=62708 RepID=A0A420IHC6_9PEZI|nr:putative at hook domain-containing protein [Golovinomyces cichoracearum]
MNREVFSESEKRFLVTEILKASSVPLDRILLLFNELNEGPHWEHIYFPPGRTLQECKATFEALRSAHCLAFGLPTSPAFYRTPYALIPDSAISSRTTFYKRKADFDNVESPQFVSLKSK